MTSVYIMPISVHYEDLYIKLDFTRAFRGWCFLRAFHMCWDAEWMLLKGLEWEMATVEKLSFIKPSSAAVLQALKVYVKLTEAN